MAQIPTTALTATNRAPKRSSTIERPLSGSNAVGVHDGDVSGVEHLGGHDQSTGAGGDGEGNRDVHPDPQWRHRPDQQRRTVRPAQ